MRKLRAVFERMRLYNLKLNPKKCQFLRSRIVYLGHVCTEHGIEPNPELVKAVRACPIPNNEKKLKSFLGMANYYRKFIKNFATIAMPLTKLLKKSVEFQFSDKCLGAFEELKRQLSDKIVLQYPDWTKPFQIYVDASGYGLGGVLEQNGRPIAYASRLLNSAEQRYSTIDRELLAIVWATKQWKCYLLGRHFTVYTDHKPLKGTVRVKDASSRILRFHQKLSEFDFDVVYRAGSQNHNADYLSRIPQPNGESENHEDERIEFTCVVTRRQAKLSNPFPPGREDAKEKTDADHVLPKEDQPTQTNEATQNKENNKDKVSQVPTGNLTENNPSTLYPNVMIHLSDPGEIQKVMEEHHGSLMAGHYGMAKTYESIKRKFDWKGMKKDIEQYVKSCPICQKTKTGRRKVKAPLVITDNAQRPFEKLYVDVVGPLPPSGEEGYKYIFSVCDCLSRFVIFRPMKDQTSETLARVLFEEVVCKFMVPEVIVSDNGPSFVSKLMQDVYKIMKVKQVRTTAYHPQSNLVERQHQSLGNYLRAFVDKHPSEWHPLVYSAAFAHNATVNRTTGFAPMELVFGFRADVPSSFTRAAQSRNTYQGYCDKLRYRMQLAWQEARETTMSNKLKAKDHYDKQISPRQFHVGDQVLMFTENRSKLDPYREGPFRVVTVYENETVSLWDEKKIGYEGCT